MSGYDIFAWIVLIILLASAIGVFCIAGWLPGHIAKSRNHPYAQAVTVAGWITLLFGLALWPLAFIWAFLKPSSAGPLLSEPRSAPHERPAGKELAS